MATFSVRDSGIFEISWDFMRFGRDFNDISSISLQIFRVPNIAAQSKSSPCQSEIRKLPDDFTIFVEITPDSAIFQKLWRFYEDFKKCVWNSGPKKSVRDSRSLQDSKKKSIRYSRPLPTPRFKQSSCRERNRTLALTVVELDCFLSWMFNC